MDSVVDHQVEMMDLQLKRLIKLEKRFNWFRFILLSLGSLGYQVQYVARGLQGSRTDVVDRLE